MTAPPPGAQISEDGYYWWNENTGDANEPARWELMADPATAASSTAATQGAASGQAQSQDPAQDPSQQQSTTGDVTLEWQYTTDDEMSLALDDLVASGWEPGSEDETA
ncbi:MAG TPA: hypothetical protein VGN18_14540 [Jatrophihabitans sp.]|jgi:hypothetical protein|uniref:hypothetical protein n=1 Tax=Jatrophihabitans sp. TaxID=1932789 RepID=UPI002E089BEE|nr:hypothetical protein [Jatrophihabitans sp.]